MIGMTKWHSLEPNADKRHQQVSWVSSVLLELSDLKLLTADRDETALDNTERKQNYRFEN
jgi:hypothetical protein